MKEILKKWRKFEGNTILKEIWRIFLRIWRNVRLGMAIVPSYRRTIVSYYCVKRWYNGQSKPEVSWTKFEGTYSFSATVRRVIIYWINLCIGVNVADAVKIVLNLYFSGTVNSNKHAVLTTLSSTLLGTKKKTIKKSEIWVTFFTIGCVFYRVGDWVTCKHWTLKRLER